MSLDGKAVILGLKGFDTITTLLLCRESTIDEEMPEITCYGDPALKSKTFDMSHEGQWHFLWHILREGNLITKITNTHFRNSCLEHYQFLKKNASLAVICHHRFIILAEENVTWQIQLIWLSFAIIFSSFCWRKSNMVDSAYLDIICLHLFTLLLGEEWHGRLSLSGCPFVFIFSSFLWKKKWRGSFSFSGWHLLSFFHHLWQKKKQTDMTDSGWM